MREEMCGGVCLKRVGLLDFSTAARDMHLRLADLDLREFGGGRFKNVTASANTATRFGSVTMALADIDGDGLPEALEGSGVYDLHAINVNTLGLNRAGMDTISAGATVAFAIDCFEHGLISKIDTGGLELGWGNTEAIVQIVDQMIRREGFGALLADGVKAAVARLGPASEPYAFHAGGQELPMHDPRHDPGYAVLYVADPTPGRHTTGSILYYEMFQLWRKVKGTPRPSARFYPKAHKYRSGRENAEMAAVNSKRRCSNRNKPC